MRGTKKQVPRVSQRCPRGIPGQLNPQNRPSLSPQKPSPSRTTKHNTNTTCGRIQGDGDGRRRTATKFSISPAVTAAVEDVLPGSRPYGCCKSSGSSEMPTLSQFSRARPMSSRCSLQQRTRNLRHASTRFRRDWARSALLSRTGRAAALLT